MPRVSDMKERLTEAAMGLIWENSYGATSVDAICERAGAKKGSFYYFFKSKSELAAAALEGDWSARPTWTLFFRRRFRLSRGLSAILIMFTIDSQRFRKSVAPFSVAPY